MAVRERWVPFLANADAKFLHDPYALLLILRSHHPEFIAVLHNLGENGTTKEYHVLPAWWIFDADFEFLQLKRQHYNKKLLY